MMISILRPRFNRDYSLGFRHERQKCNKDGAPAIFEGMNERFVPVRHNEDLVDLRANEPLADGNAWSPSWRASKIDDVPVFAAILA